MIEEQESKKCTKSGEQKPLTSFARRGDRPGKRKSHCMTCMSAKPSTRAGIRRSKKREVAELREQVRAAKARPCADCGGSFPYYVMDLDHIDPSQKRCPITRATTKGRKVTASELAKCEAVCANCHRVRTARDIKQRTYEPRKVDRYSPDVHVEWCRFNHAKLREKKRALIHQAKAAPCADCGRQYPPNAMDFDHRDPTQKLRNVSQMAARPVAVIMAEIAKCDLVCANCHRERTQSAHRSMDGAPFEKRERKPVGRYRRSIDDVMPGMSDAERETAICRLSPSFQRLIRLRYIHGMTTKDIASMLGRPEQSVASHISRAMRLVLAPPAPPKRRGRPPGSKSKAASVSEAA